MSLFCIHYLLVSIKIQSRSLKYVLLICLVLLTHKFHLRKFYVFQNGAEDVKRHKWFKGLEWEDVVARKLTVSNLDCQSFRKHTVMCFSHHFDELCVLILK